MKEEAFFETHLKSSIIKTNMTFLWVMKKTYYDIRGV